MMLIRKFGTLFLKCQKSFSKVNKLILCNDSNLIIRRRLACIIIKLLGYKPPWFNFNKKERKKKVVAKNGSELLFTVTAIIHFHFLNRMPCVSIV